jgi:nucleoside-diphosphate-sugar epimerase
MSRNYSRALVTGGAGFIGSHIVDKLIRDDFEVTVLDNLVSGREENLSAYIGKKGFHFVKGDIRDPELAQRLVKEVDFVFHEAAIIEVSLSVKDPRSANDVNLNGTLNLLEAGLNSDLKRFILASSCAVYGDSQVSPQHENLSSSPLSPYAASKASAEAYCKAFHKVYGLRTVSLRLFNVYGPRQMSGEYSGVIAKFVDRLFRNEPMIIHGDGGQTRDFTYVEDVVDAHVLAATCPEAPGEVINVGTGVATTISQLTETLMEVMSVKELRPKHDEPRLGDVKHSCGDITKAKRVLGYQPKFSLKEGLRKFAEWKGSKRSARFI